MAAGKWKDTYAATNIEEYWAEGVQDWFNVNAEVPKPDGKHNQVNTRKELKAYDRGLYDILSEFFPATNEQISCHKYINKYRKMKKNNIVLFGIAVLCACSVPKERQPLTGGQWGEIKNGSAEEVVSSEVLYWQAPPASKEVLHFYDATAHDGTRSLCISADGLANGYWNNRVNLKPWSKYRFKGWIKCENVVAEPQGGSRIPLAGSRGTIA